MPAACSRRTATFTWLRIRLDQIARLRREKGERGIAPVVAQPPLHQEAVLHEGVHRQQFDRGDAEAA